MICCRNVFVVCLDRTSAATLSTGWALGASADPRVPLVSPYFRLLFSSLLTNTRHVRIIDTSQLLRDQLKWLTEAYPTTGGIYISEFGFGEPVSNTQPSALATLSHTCPTVRGPPKRALPNNLG